MHAIACLLTFGLCTGSGLTPDDHKEPSVKPPVFLVRGDKVYIRADHVIDNGAVLIQGGRIVAVGTDLQLPEGARELRGKVVCPGFVDPWSSFGLESMAGNNDRTDASTLATDAIDPFIDARLQQQLLRAGITTYRVQPAERTRECGIGALIRLRPGADAKASTLLGDCCVAATVGVSGDGRGMDVFDRVNDIDRLVGSIADGWSYIQDRNEYKHDLVEWEKKIAEEQKKLDDGFKKAKKDREKEQADAKEKQKEFKDKTYKEDKKPTQPRYDPEKETLARVASGELPLIVEVHRAAEMRNLLDATARFERLRMIIAGGTEALAVAEQLKARKIPVIVWPAPMGQSRPDQYAQYDLALAAQLKEAGVEVLLGSGGADAATRDLPLLAALAVGHGLGREAALEALTIGAARALDVADRIGSLEVGKDADLIVLDGEPLATTSRVHFVLSGGELVIEE